MTDSELRIAGSPSVDGLDRLKADILATLGRGAARIETGELEKASLPLVQTLFAAQRAAVATGASLEIAVPGGGALEAALARFGLTDATPFKPLVEDGIWAGLVKSGDHR